MWKTEETQRPTYIPVPTSLITIADLQSDELPSPLSPAADFDSPLGMLSPPVADAKSIIGTVVSLPPNATHPVIDPMGLMKDTGIQNPLSDKDNINVVINEADLNVSLRQLSTDASAPSEELNAWNLEGVVRKDSIPGYTLTKRLPETKQGFIGAYLGTETATGLKVIINFTPSASLGSVARLVNHWYVCSEYCNGMEPAERMLDKNLFDKSQNAPEFSLVGARGVLKVLKLLYMPETKGLALVALDPTEGEATTLANVLPIVPRDGSKDEDAAAYKTSLIPRSQSDVVTALKYCLKILDILHDVHSRGFTQNGLIPSKIYIDKDENVHIGGWDFTFFVKSEMLKSPFRAANRKLSGDWIPYMSPESTAEVNLPVDYRSDFYSFGVILYELLVSKVPFFSSDVSRISTMHVLQAPTIPDAAHEWIPKKLRKLVLTLLEKDPDRRYQSASLIMLDLNEILREISPQDAWGSVPDNLPVLSFRFPRRTFGRAEVVSKVTDLLYSDKKVSSAIMFTGPEGIGKSRMLLDLKSTILAKNEFYAYWRTDKFDQTGSVYTFAISVLRQVIHQIMATNKRNIVRWRSLLVNNVKVDMTIMFSVIPELKELLGNRYTKTMPNSRKALLTEYLSLQLEASYKHAIKCMFGLFSKRGLNVCLDDIQRVSMGEFKLIEEISQFVASEYLPGEAKLIVIATYETKDDGYKFYRSPKSLRFFTKSSLNFKTVPLERLGDDALKEYVKYCTRDTSSAHMGTPVARDGFEDDLLPDRSVQLFSDVVSKIARGNPLLVEIVVRSMIMLGILSTTTTEAARSPPPNRSERLARLTVNEKKLYKSKIPTNTSQYYLKLFKPHNKMETLRYAACICGGMSFSLADVIRASKKPLTEVYKDLKVATSWGVISANTVFYKFPFDLVGSDKFPPGFTEAEIERMAAATTYQFIHDSYQDIILSDLNSSGELENYQRVCGLRLYESMSNKAVSASRYFELAHFFLASYKIATREDKSIYVNVLTTAGWFAYGSYDFQLALKYFNTTVQLLNNRDDFEMLKRLHLVIFQVLLAHGKIEKSLAFADELLEDYADPLDKVQFLLCKLRSLVKMERTEDAFKIGMEALALLGSEVTDDEVACEELARHTIIPSLPRSFSEVRRLNNLPPLTDKHIYVQQLICNELLSVSFKLGKVWFGKAMLIWSIKKMIDSGRSNAFAYFLSLYAAYLARDNVSLGLVRSMEYEKLAFKLLNEAPSTEAVQVYKCFCFTVGLLVEPAADVLRYAEMFVFSAKPVSQPVTQPELFTEYCFKTICWFFMDCPLSDILRRLSSSKFVGELSDSDSCSLCISAVKVLKGEVCPDTFTEAELGVAQALDYSEAVYAPDKRRAFYSFKLLLASVLGNHSLAIQVLTKELEAYRKNHPVSFFTPLVCFWGLLSLVKQNSEDHIELLNVLYTDLKSYAKFNPAVFRSKYLLIAALIKTKDSGAPQIEILDLFESAIAAASDHGLLYDHALICEELGGWLLSINSKSRAAKFIREAIRFYTEWDSDAKTTQLNREYGILIRGQGRSDVGGHYKITKRSTGSTSAPVGLYPGESLSSGSDQEKTRTPSMSLQYKATPQSWMFDESAVDDTEDDYGTEHGLDADSSAAPGSISYRSSIQSLKMTDAIKACIDISESIDFAGIVSKTLESLISITDSTFGAIVFVDDSGKRYLQAVYTSDTGIKHFEKDALSSKADVCPVNLFNDCIRQNKAINREEDRLFFDGHYFENDPYFEDNRVQAALCYPIRSQLDVIGAIYLESDTSSRTRKFDAKHVDIVGLISSQTAVSLSQANLYNQMFAAKKAAEDATAEKASFLANMSHEIRTPFNSLLSCAIFLLDTNLNKVQREYVETIKSSALVTLNIIDGILGFSKIEHGSIMLADEPFSLVSCIESAVQLVAEQAASKDIEMVFHNKCGNIDTIRGDVTRFRQIVINLTGNAVKFCNEGHVLIETHCRQLGSEDRYEFSVSVHDTGIGIPYDSRDKVFGAFSQVDGSSRREYGGAGLGLAISKRLAELMGGALSFESVEGQGSTFWFTFATNIERPKQVSYPQFEGKKVLVVDDHQLGRMALKDELERLGFNVDISDDTNDCKQRLAAQYSFVFLHVELLKGDFDLGLQLRRQHPHTNFVLTGQFGVTFPQKLTNGGLFSILLIPFQRSKLMEVLETEGSEIEEATRELSLDEASLAESHPLRILVAEDNIVNTRVVLQHLKRLGYKADNARDGQEAIDKCSALVASTGSNYDLILMDIQMPKMDGIAASTELSRRFKGALMPRIVALTANVAGEDRNRCLESGMDGFLSKPLLPEDLAHVLKETSS